jgi:hypothetical protein
MNKTAVLVKLLIQDIENKISLKLLVEQQILLIQHPRFHSNVFCIDLHHCH